jgi:hypothetical protein
VEAGVCTSKFFETSVLASRTMRGVGRKPELVAELCVTWTWNRGAGEFAGESEWITGELTSVRAGVSPVALIRRGRYGKFSELADDTRDIVVGAVVVAPFAGRHRQALEKPEELRAPFEIRNSGEGRPQNHE